jgi:aldehyde:ferredoxin oxidoreductase
MGRLFLQREGFTNADDTISARAFHRLSDGPIADKGLMPDELRQWLRVYYQRMGWDAEGNPTTEALGKLNLNEFR